MIFAAFQDESEGEYENGDCAAIISGLDRIYKEGDETLWESNTNNQLQLVTH
jgi:hypothetical protein